MKKVKPNISVEEFLSGFPPQIASIAKELRNVIMETIPEYFEAVYPGWKVIGYRVINGKKSYYFAFIHPTAERAVLGFEYGVLMSDPDRILIGENETKQVRWIEFTSKKEIKKRTLSQYVSEAALIALSRHDIIKSK